MQIASITVHAAPLRRATSAAKTRARSADDAERNRTRCSSCNMRDLCLPGGLAEDQMAAFSDTVYTRKRVKRATRSIAWARNSTRSTRCAPGSSSRASSSRTGATR
jgi:hypothetical protein